jgi:predicted metal-dependent peptidase
LAIDVSGSLTDELIRLCRGAIMPAARRAKKTTIITFDQTIREEVTARNPAKLLAELKMTTGYHSCTDVRPVFARVDALRPASLAVITDGRLIYPDKPYPKTNWLILPGGTPPPWGRIYAMETTW